MRSSVECVVVGAGQAGLGVSMNLQERGVEHVVLEQGEIGNTWRTQRWDSFRLNTPNHLTALPGESFGGDPDAFAGPEDLAAWFEAYVADNDLPVSTGVTVTGVDADPLGFVVKTDDPARPELHTGSVVIASGPMLRPRIPAVAADVPADVVQVHAGDYRNPDGLPPGAVLVVGTAQSGCQIVEDLLEGGRRVFACVSSVGRVPRTYRGRDITGWFTDLGFLDMRVEDLPDPAMAHAAWPQVSGVGPRGRSVSLQLLADRGATLVGRLIGVAGRRLLFGDTVAEAIRFGDAASDAIKTQIEAHIAKAGVDAPPPEHDPGDVPCPDPDRLAGPQGLDLDVERIGSIVWCTGFEADLGWVHLPVLDDRGEPVEQDGISPVPGIFFMGLPWMRHRKSAILAGVAGDAAFIADAVVAHLASG